MIVFSSIHDWMLSNYNQKVRIDFLLKTNLNDTLEERFLKGKITGGEDPFSRVLGIILIGYPHLIKIKIFQRKNFP